MSDTNEPKPRTTPQPVLNAQAALAQLRAQDAQLAARIATLLPGYAVRMDQRGEDTSVAALVAAAQRGPAALKEVFAQAAAPLTLPERYTKWVADTRPPEQPPQRRAHPYQHYDGYNTFTDEFAMRVMPPPMGWHPRDIYEMDRMAYEMDRHIHPREARYHHAMATRQARDMQRYTRFYEQARRAMQESDPPRQLAIAKELVAHAEPPAAMHFLASLAHTRRLDLLEQLLPLASQRFRDARAMDVFVHSVLYPAIYTAKEEFLLRLLDMRELLAASSGSQFITKIIMAPGMDNEAIATVLDMPLPHLNDDHWLSIAQRIIKNDALLRKAFSRISPDAGTTLRADKTHQAMLRIAADAQPQTLEELANHPIFAKAAWSEMLRHHARGLSAEAIRLFARKADIATPGWAEATPLHHLRFEFKNIDSARAYLACLPADYIKANIDELVHKGAQQRNERDERDELSPAPFLQALTELPVFAEVPVFMTLAQSELFKTYPRMLLRLLNCMDLKQLSEQQRSEIMRAHNHHHHSAVALILSGSCPQDDKNKALQAIAPHVTEGRDKAYSAYLLVKYGADVSVLPEAQRAQIAAQRAAYDNWQRVTRSMPPEGLMMHDPAPFKAPLFADILAIMKTEQHNGTAANHFAYRATALFQSEERVLQYLQKWGDTKSRQPLHNLLLKIELPQGDLDGVNLNNWGDAVLRHGPEMAKLVKFCKDIPSPARSDDGAGWSLAKTREIAAQFVYVRGSEHRELASLCHKHSVSESNFNAALDIIARTSAHEKDLPKLDIAGKDFGMPNARFRLLDSGDVRGLFMGELTDCCQSIGGAGAKCATHGFTSPNGGFYVVETDKGEIIGQTWAWRGDKGELVFDSLEMLKDRVSPQQWQDLVAQVVKHVGARKAQHGITAFMIGTSGETPAAFSKLYPKIAAQTQGYTMYANAAARDKADAQRTPAQPRDYSGYRDSNNQYLIWQKPEEKAPARRAKPK